MVIAKLSGVADRDRPRRCAASGSTCRARALPAPAEEEYYHADLVGLAAHARQTARRSARCIAVHDFGAGECWRSRGRRASRCMVPFTRAAVPVVDIAAGRVVIDPPDGPVRPAERAASAKGAGMTWRATVLTIFPEMLPGPLGLFARRQGAEERGCGGSTRSTSAISRTDKHRSVDDAPFGGGPGMVLRPDVLDAAIAGAGGVGPLINLSPRGRPLDQAPGPRAGGRTRRAADLRPLRGRRRARARSECASRKSASAISCCRAASPRRSR